jgi:hypothetical protein
MVHTAITTSSLDCAIWTTCKQLSTLENFCLLITTASFLLACSPGSSTCMVTALFPDYQRRRDRECPRLFRNATRSPTESTCPPNREFFRVISFVLAIWTEYSCECAQMLDWSSWRGRGCALAVDVDRWPCLRRSSPPRCCLGLSHDGVSYSQSQGPSQVSVS